jgi:hypothetical protein
MLSSAHSQKLSLLAEQSHEYKVMKTPYQSPHAARNHCMSDKMKIVHLEGTPPSIDDNTKIVRYMKTCDENASENNSLG